MDLREFDEGLFSELKKLRNNIARQEKVPAYIVFTDATLRDMCCKYPETLEELLNVAGVGAVKMEKYGPAFTELIRGYGNGAN